MFCSAATAGFAAASTPSFSASWTGALAAEDETPHIISCSRKASAYLREHSLAYEEFILSDVPDYEETHALCEHLKKLYTTGAVNRVRLIYQSYRNMLSQEPTDRQILPDPESHKTANPDGVLYLPSPAAIGAPARAPPV